MRVFRKSDEDDNDDDIFVSVIILCGFCICCDESNSDVIVVVLCKRSLREVSKYEKRAEPVGKDYTKILVIQCNVELVGRNKCRLKNLKCFFAFIGRIAL